MSSEMSEDSLFPMARPLRLEFPGAVYHITARGNARELIFTDDRDRRCFVDFFAREFEQQGWRCYAWCLMGNHYLCGASHNT